MNAETSRWSNSSMSIHWASAFLLVAMLTIGFVMTGRDAADPIRRILGRIHSMSGVAVGVLTVVRLIRRRKTRPSEPLEVPEPHRKGIAVVHGSLYAVVFAIVATGIATAARTAWHPYMRGELASAPALGTVASRNIHEVLVNLLLVLISAHVVGVIVQEIRRGKTLRRMAPFLR